MDRASYQITPDIEWVIPQYIWGPHSVFLLIVRARAYAVAGDGKADAIQNLEERLWTGRKLR